MSIPELICSHLYVSLYSVLFSSLLDEGIGLLFIDNPSNITDLCFRELPVDLCHIRQFYARWEKLVWRFTGTSVQQLLIELT